MDTWCDSDATTVVSLFQHSPLLLAAEEGHAACVSILLKHGADVGQKSKYGYNCLMIAIERKFRYGKFVKHFFCLGEQIAIGLHSFLLHADLLA